MLIKKEEKMMSKRKKKGFTLIELIVVIAILGILAAIAVPRLAGFTTSSQGKSDDATAVSITHAAKAYYASVTPNAYPVPATVGDFTAKLVTDTKLLDSIPTPQLSTDKWWFNSTEGLCVASDTAANAATESGVGVAADYAEIK